jgi:hypothetical protein
MQKIYKFVIGYHELEGTKVPLRKPMVIMKKVKLDDGMEVDNVSSTPSTEASLEMRVVGVVRHKLLFKNRPKAIISSKSRFSLLESVGMVVRPSFLKEQNFVSTENFGSSYSRWFLISKKIEQPVERTCSYQDGSGQRIDTYLSKFIFFAVLTQP